MSMLSILLKPKVLFGIFAAAFLIGAGLYVRGQIKDYGQARYDQGKADCEAAVRKKVAETKTKVDTVKAEAKAEAEKTQTVYVEVVKTVAVTDATIVAENAALKTTIETLEERITNATPDMSACAREPIPDDSLSVHIAIDRLLRAD